ncbi:type III-B CRISPR module-associated protein Cmr3 [Thermoanaerobacterium thermosaccharolyticum]|uniref:type III-B CRISPR module-associated protein Cmr3 n=1 Tax=Thermoanaerobacterium thermosaccharolyticum TaxID=1517 RepID=UPI003D28373B
MLIKIKPLDTLFFRTPKPFFKGEDTWSDSFFPPYPSTVYGAVRSYLIFKNGTLEDFYNGKYRDIIGTQEEKGKIVIKGPFLAENGKPIFKVPYDLVCLKGDNETLHYLQFRKKPSLMISNYNLDNALLWRREGVVDNSEGWLNFIDFKEYLTLKAEEFSYIESKSYFEEEDKIGINIDENTKSSKYGHLYRISMIRLKENAELIVEIEGIDSFDEKGVLQLGGKARAAVFEKGEDVFNDLKNLKFNLNDGLFKIYLATPAIFKKGWLPYWINENTLIGEFKGIKLKLLACAIGKPIFIGGWDIAQGNSKPLNKAVPAGSVYYFELLNDMDLNTLKEAFHFKNISDEKAEEGFGLSFIGEVR